MYKLHLTVLGLVKKASREITRKRVSELRRGGKWVHHEGKLRHFITKQPLTAQRIYIYKKCGIIQNVEDLLRAFI